MGYAIQWVRSLIFAGQMYLAMAVLAFVYAPLAFISPRYAFAAIHRWCNYVRWSASWMIGLKSEVRGPVPDGEVMVAAKHQSFFDIIILASVLPRPKYIMKKQILWTPFVGVYAKRIGCVAVDRGKRGAAIRRMVESVRSGEQQAGQLVIYPQGTRVDPGRRVPFKVGAGVLYSQMGTPVVPVACNVGVFWPRRRIYRQPGLAVVEFLPMIEANLPIDEFIKRVEDVVETRSNALMRDAGFTGDLPEPGTNSRKA